MTPSLNSRILSRILRLLNFKKRVEKKANKKISRTSREFVPRGIKRAFRINIRTFHSKTIATFESREKVTNKHIIFFHGGAYIFEIAPGHWRIAERIIKKSFCRMTLIDYPLAPEYSFKQTFEMVQGAYDLLVEKYPADNFILMGDSAGGGLALALIQKLILEKHSKIPIKNILLSPWLDLTLSNPDIKNLESSDHILTVGMLKIAGFKYSAGDDMKNYLLSPINGEFRDIPQTIVYYGSEELFSADCKRLKKMQDPYKNNIILKEYK